MRGIAILSLFSLAAGAQAQELHPKVRDAQVEYRRALLEARDAYVAKLTQVGKELAADGEFAAAAEVKELRELVEVSGIQTPSAKELQRRQAEEKLIGTVWRLKAGTTRFLKDNRTVNSDKHTKNWIMTDPITVLVQDDKPSDPVHIWKFNAELTRCRLLKYDAATDYKNLGTRIGSR